MSIGIISIATNVYLNYWKNLASSIDRVTNNIEEITLHVFTDQLNEAEDFGKTLFKVKVVAHLINPLGWPDATLKRYEIFSNFAHEIPESLLLYLDADMIVEKDFCHDIREILSESKIALVAHPGYWREGITSELLESLGNPITLVRTFKSVIFNKRRGSWEDNVESAAFVPKEYRKIYVCGGVWMGRRKELLDLIFMLKNAVNRDLSNGVMAKWHDESHLNHWAAFNEYKLLNPSFCYVKEYKHLSNLEIKIVAVTKDVKTR